MARTLTSKRMRWALYQAADGKCQLCGRELGPDWHADHIVPWSVSGKTNVHDMQALCPGCNLKKGALMPLSLRKHQRGAVEIAQQIANSTKPQDCLFWVVPGGGKSWLPNLMLQHLPGWRVAWFVPRISLRDQAEKTASEDFGVRLRGSGNDTNPCRGMPGFIATHQALTENPGLWRRELERQKYLLIVDEVHHAKIDKRGNENSLTRAIKELPYSARLLMTGTLETNDATFIYGVKYRCSSGVWMPDPESFDGHFLRYTRLSAIEENALVPVEFHHHDGPVQWQSIQTRADDECVLSEATREQESNAIFTALTTGIADAILNSCLEHHKHYGGKLLVVVHNQSLAKERHRQLQSRMPTFLAISDNDAARDDIATFKKTARSCLVTCQMAYEGLDDKDITHIACLTNIRSVPWIEQMIGRAWRAKPGKSVCYCFVPDDPRMNRVISRIHSEQPSGISEKTSDGGGGEGWQPAEVLPKHSLVDLVRVAGLDGINRLTPEQQELREYAVQRGCSPDNPHLVALIASMSQTQTPGRQEMTPSQEEDFLCIDIATICRSADKRKAALNGVDKPKFGAHQKLLIRRTGKAIRDMTLDELRIAHEIAKSYLA